MSDIIQTKYCPKCKQIKPVSEFSPDKSRKDGCAYQCKKCKNKYWKRYYHEGNGKKCAHNNYLKCKDDPQYIRIRRKCVKKYHCSLKGKLVCQKFNKTEKGKERYRKFRKTQKRKEYIKNYYKKHSQKIKAIKAVNHCVEKGLMPKISTLLCKCGKQAEQYHHYLGYTKVHWFDVVPLCITCHNIAHDKIIHF